MRICVVKVSTGLVENVSEMGGNDLPPNASQPQNPPAGYAWIQHDTAGLGWRLVNGALVDERTVEQPSPPPSTAELEAACIAGTTAAPLPRQGFDVQRAFIAHVISTEAYRLGVAPGALSGAQLTAIRNRIAAIYKAL